MLVLLVGPKGSGKSHIGRLLDLSLDVHFFHVEPHWMLYYAECRAAGLEPTIAGGIARVHPRIQEALQVHRNVCVETTGASIEIFQGLLALAEPAQSLIVRVSAPLGVCLQRIAGRDATHQIPIELEECRRIHELALALEFEPDLAVENVGLSDAVIVGLFAERIAPVSGQGP